MKQSEALTIVNQLISIVQKVCSNEREVLHAMAQAETYQLSIEVETRVAKRGSIEPQEFYNFLYIAHRLQPDIAAVGEVLGVTLPEPDMQIVRGWDDE